MSIVKRVFFGFSLLCTLMVVIATSNYINTHKLNGYIQKITHESTPILIATFPLAKTVQESYQTLSKYTSQRDRTKLISLLETAYEKEAQFFESFESFVELQKEAHESALPIKLRESAENYFNIIATMMSDHDGLLLSHNNLKSLNEEFVKFEDAYSWSKEAIMNEASHHLPTLNRVEFVINSIEQTIKNVRRIDTHTALEALEKQVSKDIALAMERISTLKITERTKKSYLNALEQLKTITVTGDGLIANTVTERQLQHAMIANSEELSIHADATQELIQELIINAENQSLQIMNSADNATQTAISLAVTVTVVSLIIALIVGTAITYSIKKPLQKITPVLLELSNGVMTTRTQHRSKTEFGVIAQAIDTLAEKTSLTLSDIKDSAKKLSEEASVTGQSSVKTLELVERQKSQTDLVATAISEMESSAEEVSSYTIQTLSEVQQASKATEAGRVEVQKNREITQGLVGNIEHAVLKSQELAKFTENIGSILEVIRGIAEQTNLLALNAAIEAARAGDQGRGFAVVADEVRSLANRSHESTEQIEVMIESLQRESQSISAQMSECLQQTTDCNFQTELTEQSFMDILHRVEQISDMSTQVAQSTTEQITVISDISRHINGIADGANDTEQEAEKSANSSETLSMLVKKQQMSISKFEI